MKIISLELSDSDILRFWQKVKKGSDSECWEWLGAKSKEGYGRFKVKGKLLSPHRVALCLSSSNLSSDLYGCHHCDNPSCCNPNHLYWGTQSQNMKDCQNKGRNCKETQTKNLKKGEKTRGSAQFHSLVPQVGSKNKRAKLNEEQVAKIKSKLSQGYSSSSLAQEFNVSPQLINSISRGKLWKHVI
jgi:HNH endonuclease